MTPINVERLLHHLNISKYPTHLTNYLIDGFTNGFPLGHSTIYGNNVEQSKKIPPHLQDVFEQKINTELISGRIVGPFSHPPFEQFQISPLSLREKDTPGKFRMIHNLSFPHDDSSINANIPECEKSEKFSH